MDPIPRKFPSCARPVPKIGGDDRVSPYSYRQALNYNEAMPILKTFRVEAGQRRYFCPVSACLPSVADNLMSRLEWHLGTANDHPIYNYAKGLILAWDAPSDRPGALEHLAHINDAERAPWWLGYLDGVRLVASARRGYIPWPRIERWGSPHPVPAPRTWGECVEDPWGEEYA